VITLEPERHHLIDDDISAWSNPVFPHICITRAAQFNDYSPLSEISCMQIGDSGLYVTWYNDPDNELELPNDGITPSTVFCIDVNQSMEDMRM
jgi:hypothetical protein